MENKNKQFVHLHVHTEYSLLDGLAHIKDIFPFCRKMNMPAIAITDHGNMYGAMDYFHAAQNEFESVVKKIKLDKAIEEYERKLKDDPENAGQKPNKDDIVFDKKVDPKIYSDLYIKPIIGCEFYVVDNMHERGGKNDHLVLIAKNDVGYHNLMKLNTLAWLEGFYSKWARIDLECLEKYKEGLICLSACIAGRIPKLIIDGRYEDAKAYAIRFKEMFGEDFYLEIQNHRFVEDGRNLEQLANIGIIRLSKELGVKLVATNDAHYIYKEDAQSHDVLLCIQTASYVDEEKRLRFPNDEFYLKSYDEMAELFPEQLEALDNTLEVMNKIDLPMPEKKQLLPPFDPGNGQTPAEFLRSMTISNLYKRYKNVTDEILERANYELSVIIDMGYVEYFLIVWDFIRFARENDIPVGAGRGSGVGSIVAYSIGITNVDPLRYHLIFERFLNKERVSMPDFDIDFCSVGRSRVIEYVTQKYGKANVTQIITFSTLAAKQAIKDVARTYRVPPAEVDKITKTIPTMPGLCLKGVMGWYDENDPKDVEKYHKMKSHDVIELYKTDPTVKMIIDFVQKLEGTPRNTGMHAAGVVICRDDVSLHIPLQHNDGIVTTQYPKDQVEELGLLKMDFLGLTNLTDLKYTKQYILENRGIDVDFSKLGYEDPAVYQLISSGETDAVFQLESAGMKQFMRDLAPSGMEDIIAGISLYRPGPMDSIPTYVANKKNPDQITYVDPRLKPILDNTYGVIVYQEQVMQIVREIGGYSFGRADILRRIMSKKKQKAMMEQRSIFLYGQPGDGKNSPVEGAIARGMSKEVALKLFDDMTSFARYAFNKSHAAAYAVLSYETAYMKKYYMPEFITGVLNNRTKVSDDVEKYIGYLRDHGVPVLPPDVNKSKTLFSTDGKTVRYGLSVIKGTGYEASEKIVEERDKNGPYTSFSNLLERQEIMLNKTTIESLIMGGACDCFGHTRAALMRYYDQITSGIIQDRKHKAQGQLSLFDGFLEDESGSNEDLIKECDEFEKGYLLSAEKKLLCVYMSGHPLDDYREAYKSISFKLEQLREEHSGDADEMAAAMGDFGKYDGQTVKVGGRIADAVKRTDRRGNEMCVGVLEDLDYQVDIVCYAGQYQAVKQIMVKNNIVLVTGRLNYRDGVYSLVVSSLTNWIVNNNTAVQSGAKQKSIGVRTDFTNKILLVEVTSQSYANAVERLLSSYSGNSDVYFKMNGHFYIFSTKASYSDELLEELYALVGRNNVKLMDRKN